MKKNEAHCSSTSIVNVERVQVSIEDQVEAGHLASSSQNEIHDSYVEGDHMPNQADVEGEHHTISPLVEGEPSGSSHDEGNDEDNDFHDITDNISIAGDVSDDEIFEKEPSEFDST